jgi:Txe/YoeB family toxin of toxin-antitoxin system
MTKDQDSPRKFCIVLSKNAEKDIKIASKSPYYPKLLELLEILKQDPYQSPPAFKYLERDLKGCLSRRINIQHRIVYEVRENFVKIITCWSHYDL